MIRPTRICTYSPKRGHGRSLGAPHELGAGNVAPSEFAPYRLTIRAERPNHLRQFGRLFRRYVCDRWSKVETHRLRYARSRQETLRAASYRQGKNPPQGSTTGNNIGHRVILRPTFSGCPRQMAELYHDATAVVRTHGNPIVAGDQRRATPQTKQQICGRI